MSDVEAYMHRYEHGILAAVTTEVMKWTKGTGTMRLRVPTTVEYVGI